LLFTGAGTAVEETVIATKVATALGVKAGVVVASGGTVLLIGGGCFCSLWSLQIFK